MSSINIDNVGEMAVIECSGRFVKPESAFQLRDAVTSQRNVHTLVLDLTEVDAMSGGVVGMLAFLQRWAYGHDIRFKLFNPSRAVQAKLEHTNTMPTLEIASLDEMMALLSSADHRYALVS